VPEAGKEDVRKKGRKRSSLSIMLGGTITDWPGVPRTFGDGEGPDSWPPLGQDLA